MGWAINQKYDVWICYVTRTSYRATLHTDDDSSKPKNATGHLDTVWALGKRDAITKAINRNQNYDY